MKISAALLSGLAFFLLAAAAPVYAQDAEWKALNAEVKNFYQQGQYERAVMAAKQALEVAEKNFSIDPLMAATSLNNLAALHGIMGDYVGAEPLYRRSLAISEETLGANHPEIAIPL
ncbi:MAG: tetratricopeptide repeat protein, partial [Polaromonas sp.]|nr:tetratricopeptide repeat protein [Polaromonas sp.]